ncbi:MAG: DUF763 domain-containing protein [Nitrososphaeria archaeon]
MIKGTADLPLHWGRAPEWLYKKMVVLAGQIAYLIVEDKGKDEFLKKISDPFWFQAFGSVLGFDWHSSGLTTVTMAALKEALNRTEIGIKVAGGKGFAEKTPEEIVKISETFNLNGETYVKFSRLSAKVDGVAVQDGYSIYQHWFIISENKGWTVIQQGLNGEKGYARRYHITGDDKKDMLNDPHSGIAALDPNRRVLNLASRESEENRNATLEMLTAGRGLDSYIYGVKSLHLERFFDKRLMNIINRINPSTYEELLLTKGIGAKAVRALALTASVIYGAEPSYRDPAVFSFAHGGKDGVPYPVDRAIYETTIKYLQEVIEGLDTDHEDKKKMLRRLSSNTWLNLTVKDLRI